jgi:putative tryptophan/tyrosine transport system substrate-binding protein
VLANPLNQIAMLGLREVERAAKSLGLARIHWVEADAPNTLRTLTPEALDRTAPLLVLPDAMFWNRRRYIVALATAARVPALYPEREYADDGGLIAYGPSVADNFRRAAGYVDRILKGANPGDLPIQQPERFEFVINLKTARSLGLDLPSALLARADEVIE